jgi:asparagine synthase (glutamine-hydrolysing)
MGSEPEPDVVHRRSSSGAVAALPLTRLERAAGLPVGFGTGDLLRGHRDEPLLDPRRALAGAMVAHLERGQCYVSFSGGRDSSAVLARATAVAREHGLPDPIPITLRFPGVDSTEESSWQERVVEHLRLRRWEVIEVRDELDWLGAIAQDTLREHGLLWPPNTYFHVPMFDRARGGTLMTGFDGDGLLGNWPWARVQAVLHVRVRPEPQDISRIARALAPPNVRRRLMSTPFTRATTWLRPAATAEFRRAALAHVAAEPRRWDKRIAFYARSRHLELTSHSLRVLGARFQVMVVNPLIDPGHLASLAWAGGAAGYGGRTMIMRTLFGDVLPEDVIARPSKAEFGRALWRRRARRFAEGWDGRGLDPELVDASLLREAWRAPNPLFGSVIPLHEAWLAAQAR